MRLKTCVYSISNRQCMITNIISYDYDMDAGV